MKRAWIALALLVACDSTPPQQPRPWKGRIDLYGTMREVMMEGKTKGRIELAPLQGDWGLVGIGALEDLSGEVVLIDGVAWNTRSGPLGALDTRAGAQPGQKAAFLVTARISSWTGIKIEKALPFASIEAFVAQAAHEQGLANTPTFPFVIEGGFRDVRAHVLHGRCPEMGAGPPETEPVRRLIPLVHGRLVGFYSELEPGKLTHAGEKTHVHLLVKENESIVAHVDSLQIEPGALLKLPRTE